MGLQEKIKNVEELSINLSSHRIEALPLRKKQIEDIKKNIHLKLIEELSDIIFRKNINDVELKSKVSSRVQKLVYENDFPLTIEEKTKIIGEIIDDIVGHGPIEEVLRDKEVTEIMINNPFMIYIEKFGKIYKTNKSFIDENHLMRIIDKIVSRIGRRVDESSPYVDARLPDGSRVNIIISPLTLNGPVMTIRKFAADPFTIDDLIEMGTCTKKVAEFMKACVKGRLNIMTSGGTGTGKTTMLNVLSSFIPENERIITIEDAAELQLQQDHILRMETKVASGDGRGAV